MPGTSEVPDGNKVFLVGHAVGVQIYSCNTTPSGYSWALVAPRAHLYEENGKRVATHFGGRRGKGKTAGTFTYVRVYRPFWRLSVDVPCVTPATR